MLLLDKIISPIKKTYNLYKIIKGINIVENKDNYVVNIDKNIVIKCENDLYLINKGNIVLQTCTADNSKIYLNPVNKFKATDDLELVETNLTVTYK